MHISMIGRSVSGQGIFSYEWTDKSHPKASVLVLGGHHGNEIEGVVAAKGLMARLIEHNPFDLSLCVVPNINPDGVYRLTRTNQNGVDLNRNLPTKDWNPVATDPKYPPGPKAASEPETKTLVQLIQVFQPQCIISIHSFSNFMLNTNGDCVALAQAMQKVNSYKIEPSIGYPTPGSLGTYAVENSIPCLTYEIERGLSFDKIIEVHVPSLWAGLEFLNHSS
jgi:murein peptide amidase A